MTKNSAVLIVDDDAGVRTALTAILASEGWRVIPAGSVAEAVAVLKGEGISLVVTDVRLPDGTGMEVMRSARKTIPGVPVLLLTAFGSVPEAVEAIRAGACDYLMKPVSLDDISASVAKIMATPVQQSRNPKHDIVARSPLMLRMLDRATHAAHSNFDILIEAESGTGKELLARHIHSVSARRDKPFIAVNCAALPEQLLESELFGHERGAFTGATTSKAGKFELASGGTLLLDEIGEMPLSLQPKLLRALQEREFERLGGTRAIRVDIRVIATTNVSLQSMVNEGRFRADLYYRLNVIPLTIPPLRERPEDIQLLAEHFRTVFSAECSYPAAPLSGELLASMREHSWFGNVRELSNFVRRYIALRDPDLRPQGLNGTSTKAVGCHPRVSARRTAVFEGSDAFRELERSLLEKALAQARGNRTHAAEILGVSLRTVRNRIREYGLPPRRFA